jgi:alpha-mannosidase
MWRRAKSLTILLLACLVILSGAQGQTATPQAPDLTKQPTLYVVGYAHLDTQWRWEYPKTINEFIPRTLHDNFALLDKYPHYIFNFSGANRYRMMKEYYPADYEKLRRYVAAGRWFPAGSSVEENDVNVPSAESIMRQVLYGSQYFRREFGKSSAEYMLPDCFGFPASLPSILAHMGLRGFSTQKLTWGSAVGIPFNVGIWEGPDGRSVIAALNPGRYSSDVEEDLSKSDPWINRVQANGNKSGLFADYRYYGTGDIGGAPREKSVEMVERSATSGGPLRIVSSTAEQMFLDIKPEQTAGLPRYKGDLLLSQHSAGSLSSETYMKRWNRKNELLADAAERASVAADWLGGRPYPLQRLNGAWMLVMGSQFHDILPGTSTPKAYEYAWNDSVLAMNQFAGVLTSATEAVASALNTQTAGAAIVVYNPLSIAREDVVEATVSFPNGVPPAVRVFGPDGREVPAQLNGATGGNAKVLFLAKAPSVGYAVYDVQAAQSAPFASELRVTTWSLENGRYRVRLSQQGDVASIFDKVTHRELLSAPIRLAFQYEKPTEYPAWNMDWADQQKLPRAYLRGPARPRITEKGPVRVALEVERQAGGSRFVQTIRLSAGDAGNRVEFGNVIDWKTGESALKAVFRLTASNPRATYNWDIGTVQRGNNDSKKYEVPSHQWFDLTDKSGSFGVTVLSDCKYGSDKPDDSTLRLTLLYTPGTSERGMKYRDQATQDWGRHEFVYGLTAHAGDWRSAQTDWQGYRLNQPLIAFESSKHLGRLGKTFSMLSVSNSRTRVLAVKKAEQGDEVILRLVETDGKPAQDVRVTFAAPITAAREVNGQEQPLSPSASVVNGELTTVLGQYQIRSFAVRLAAPPTTVFAPRFEPLRLSFDRSVATRDGTKAAGGFDTSGHSLPAEMLPREIAYDGIRFSLAPGGGPRRNAMVSHGQVIALPAGSFSRLYVLAASADGDQEATLRIGDTTVDVVIQDWGGYVGQWDRRIWIPRKPEPPTPSTSGAQEPPFDFEYAGLKPGFVKRSPVAWFVSHRHTADGANEPYAYAYLFAYAIEVPANARTLTLPDNDKIRILAVTVADEAGKVRPAQPLYDTLGRPAGR